MNELNAKDLPRGLIELTAGIDLHININLMNIYLYVIIY